MNKTYVPVTLQLDIGVLIPSRKLDVTLVEMHDGDVVKRRVRRLLDRVPHEAKAVVMYLDNPVLERVERRSCRHDHYIRLLCRQLSITFASSSQLGEEMIKKTALLTPLTLALNQVPSGHVLEFVRARMCETDLLPAWVAQALRQADVDLHLTPDLSSLLKVS